MAGGKWQPAEYFGTPGPPAAMRKWLSSQSRLRGAHPECTCLAPIQALPLRSGRGRAQHGQQGPVEPQKLPWVPPNTAIRPKTHSLWNPRAWNRPWGQVCTTHGLAGKCTSSKLEGCTCRLGARAWGQIRLSFPADPPSTWCQECVFGF